MSLMMSSLKTLFSEVLGPEKEIIGKWDIILTAQTLHRDRHNSLFSKFLTGESNVGNAIATFGLQVSLLSPCAIEINNEEEKVN